LAVAVGVASHDPGAVTLVGSAGMVRANDSPLRIEPHLGQVSEYKSKPPPLSNEVWRVLHEDVARSYFANDPGHLHPEARSLSSDACTLAG